MTRLGLSLATALGTTLEELPGNTPSLARGAQVYQTNCAGCHGITGRGDGPLASALTPPPANLSDPAALRDRSPLDFYHRITIGVAGTSMPAYEGRLSDEDRWAAAVYATVLRLPVPRGEVPAALRGFPTTARMTDAEVLVALAPETGTANDSASRLAAVRAYQEPGIGTHADVAVFGLVRHQLDSAMVLAQAGQFDAASATAFDAYMTFEQVERAVRARNPGLAGRISRRPLPPSGPGGRRGDSGRAARASRAAGRRPRERRADDRRPDVGLNLFLQSFVILLREGLEAILIIGALIAFLVKTGAGAPAPRHPRRAWAPPSSSACSPPCSFETHLPVLARQPGGARGRHDAGGHASMLFYVSYWLLSKMEVAKWNRFVKGKVQDALVQRVGPRPGLGRLPRGLSRGLRDDALLQGALRGGAGGGAVLPVVARHRGGRGGAGAWSTVPSTASASGFRSSRSSASPARSSTTWPSSSRARASPSCRKAAWSARRSCRWAPRIPAPGHLSHGRVAGASGESSSSSSSLRWSGPSCIEPRRLAVTPVLVPETGGSAPGREIRDPVAPLDGETDLLRSLERMDADLAEMRAEIERIRRRLGAERR